MKPPTSSTSFFGGLLRLVSRNRQAAPRLKRIGRQAGDRSALATLLSTFEAALRLLSPFMPFITEELWHAVYDGKPPAKSIALSRYPQVLEEARDTAVEQEMAQLQELIVTIRALRKDLEIPERALATAEMQTPAAFQQLTAKNSQIIEKLARVSSFSFPAQWNLSPGNTRTTANFTVGLVYEKQIDITAERERLQKKLEQYEKILVNADRQLKNDAFLAKAPENIVAGLRKQASEAAMLRQETLDAIEKLEQFA